MIYLARSTRPITASTMTAKQTCPTPNTALKSPMRKSIQPRQVGPNQLRLSSRRVIAHLWLMVQAEWSMPHGMGSQGSSLEEGDMGVRGVLVYCCDYTCSHSTAISAHRWPDHVRLSDIEP